MRDSERNYPLQLLADRALDLKERVLSLTRLQMLAITARLPLHPV